MSAKAGFGAHIFDLKGLFKDLKQMLLFQHH
jgi:hypothetical protein